MDRIGLRQVSTERLQALLRVVHAGKLGTPVTTATLMLAGFGDVGDDMPILHGLDETGVRAALVIALAERKGDLP